MRLIRIEEVHEYPEQGEIRYVHTINPQQIRAVTMKLRERKPVNVCIQLGEGDDINVSPEVWAARTLVDKAELDPEPVAIVKEQVSLGDTVPSATGCRIALRGILAVIESGMIPQPVGETDAAYRTLVASHNRILELIREQANDALEHAGGKK